MSGLLKQQGTKDGVFQLQVFVSFICLKSVWAIAKDVLLDPELHIFKQCYGLVG